MKKSAYLPVKLTPEMKAQLQAIAAHQDHSAAWLARKYIADGLKRERFKPKTKP